MGLEGVAQVQVVQMDHYQVMIILQEKVLLMGMVILMKLLLLMGKLGLQQTLMFLHTEMEHQYHIFQILMNGKILLLERIHMLLKIVMLVMESYIMVMLFLVFTIMTLIHQTKNLPLKDFIFQTN